MKKIILLLLTLTICLFALTIFVDRSPLRGKDYSHEFGKLAIDGKTNKILDLRDFKQDSWDEMVIWFPYSRIGDYKIRFDFWSDADMINSDDGNNTILFLKQNRVVGWAKFSLVSVDFNYLEVGTGRISREKAKFGFNTEEKFTKVFLIKEK